MTAVGTFTHKSYDGVETVVTWSVDDTKTAFRVMKVTDQTGQVCTGEGQVPKAEVLAQLDAYAACTGMSGDSPADIKSKMEAAGIAEKTAAEIQYEKEQAEKAAYMAAGCDY